MSWWEATGHMGFKETFTAPKHVSNIPRFSMMVCGMFCSIAVSAIYSYSLLTEKFQQDYHFTQNDITTISTVGIVIGYFTFPFGVVYDYFGPKPIFIMGIILNVLGTLLFSLTFQGRIGHSVGGLAIINAVLNLGCALYDMGSVLTVLSWFPLDRGLVIACMKTMTGLGGSVVSTLYSTYFNGQNDIYMYFLMSWSIVIGIIAFIVIYLPPYHMTGRRLKNYTEDEMQRAAKYQMVYMDAKAPLKRFIIAFIMVGVLFIVIFTRSIVFVFIKEPTMHQKNPPTIIMIVFYVLLLAVILPWNWLDIQMPGYDIANREEGERYEEEKEGEYDECAGMQEEGALLETGDVAMASKGSKKAQSAEPAGDHDDLAYQEPNTAAENEEEDERTCGNTCGERCSYVLYKLKNMFKSDTVQETPEPHTREEVILALHAAADLEKISPQFPTGFFYNVRRPTLVCMWITGFCVSGVINVVMMNTTQIYLAISEDPTDKQRPALYVAITGIGSAVGRIVMAFIEVGTQSALAEHRVPITWFYIVAPGLGLFSCVFFLVVPKGALILPMVLAGLANGFYAACEVLTARTIFSIDISKHYNSLFFFEMLAVIFMNRLLFGEIMTKNSSVAKDGSPQCIGRKKCLQPTFIVLVVLSVVGLACGIIVGLTYMRFARREYAKRRQHRDNLEAMLAEMDTGVRGDLMLQKQLYVDENNNSVDSSALVEELH